MVDDILKDENYDSERSNRKSDVSRTSHKSDGVIHNNEHIKE